ncbi:MAG: AMIN domain-containing protein, partial [Methylococcales bacterium]
MKNFWKIWMLMGLHWFSTAVCAETVEVGGLHYWHSAKQARMMIDVTSAATHQVSVLEQPPRLVIDIPNAQLRSGLSLPSSAKELFVKVKTIHGKNKVRIIAELKKSVTTKA